MTQRIIIVGGGTAGWMAANLFAQKWFPEKASVTLIESPDIGIIGVGEGSTPTLKRFFQILNIDDAQWMPACNATYKVNIKFKDWSPVSGVDEYSHPFISQVDTFTERAFITNCRTRRYGLDTNTTPADFLLNGVLAKQNKGPITPDNFPFRMEYGYHFDSGLLGQFLANHASKLGVKHIQSKVNEIKTHSNGDIASVLLGDGSEVEGDIFVDCTGFRSLLMRETLGVEFVSFKENLFNDSAVVLQTPLTGDIPVETVSTALSTGWCWKIPLTHRFGNGYVYSSDFISHDAAEAEFRRHIGVTDEALECRRLKMNVGQLEKHWHKNCLAIGLSQGFIEPLEATALHLVQVGVELFMMKYEEGHFSDRLEDEFNRKISERFERVRDYIVAHYKLNTRNDSEYWRANRNNTHLSESLIHILDVWFKRGDLAAEIDRQNLDSHFNSISWHCLLSGYGAYPPLEPNQPGTGDLYIEQGVMRFLEGCALNFDIHQNNLTKLM